MLLEEFDKNEKAIINPEDLIKPLRGIPKVAVSCFSARLFDELVDYYDGIIISERVKSANGTIPLYEIEVKGNKIALFKAPVGAACCAASYEEFIALGIEKLILFGTCGVLNKEIEDCSIIIPNSALRDEGTSYHYLEANDEVSVNELYVDSFISLLSEHDYHYTIGKVWTTDAIYRETREKFIKRKEAGAICVDMECSAMSAVAKFRGKDFFQFFYAADNLDNATWDERSLSSEKRLDDKLKIGLLAVELACEIM